MCFSGRADTVAVWSSTRTAPGDLQAERYFTVTHPFHPWRGRRLELLESRREWGQWRLYYRTKTGQRACIPAAWTDLGPQDPFVEQARGRAVARIGDLLELAKLVAESVREIKPEV